MGIVAFGVMVFAGVILAYFAGRDLVRGGLYCAIGFAAAALVGSYLVEDIRGALLAAGPIGLAAVFAAPSRAPE
ncbi:MAG: hypothetical protein AAF909_10820 [Pseudomonadota bacterium]